MGHILSACRNVLKKIDYSKGVTKQEKEEGWGYSQAGPLFIIDHTLYL